MREAGTRTTQIVIAPHAERRVRRLHAADLFLNRFSASMGGLWRRDDYEKRIDRIESLEPRLRSLNDAELAASAQALRTTLLRSDVSGPALEHAFAIVRETARRIVGLRHHRVQLKGGLIMAGGGLAEMQTGEGKTITALLPAVAYALTGRPVHVVTVNQYLAQRDAELTRPVFEALGLTVGTVLVDQSGEERRAAYAADVTYCTNKDLVFDYLRDRLNHRAASTTRPSQQLLRGLTFAIVDEADSILIDEAQTPLIIAAERPSPGMDQTFARVLDVVSHMHVGHHFRIVADGRRIELEVAARQILAGVSSCFEGPLRSPRALEELACQALSALHLFHRDRHYIVVDDKVQIVDEYTGRLMQDRTWQFGLHQMIEAKEGLLTSGQRETLAQITYQRFFRRYVRLAGMSGTLREVATELRAVYGLTTTIVPTHRPTRRRRTGRRMFRTSREKWEAVARAAEREALAGRAVLIGTRSVAASEAASQRLSEIGLAHVVLNARQDQAEAEAIRIAGTPGRVTVATNMAGRGTDIHLSADVAKRGGLHVILTEYHESERIDRQLVGRAGRQGDEGTFEEIVSLDDEIFMCFAPKASNLAAAASRLLPIRLVAEWPRIVAQSTAEAKGCRVRRQIVKSDQNSNRSLFFAGSPD